MARLTTLKQTIISLCIKDSVFIKSCLLKTMIHICRQYKIIFFFYQFIQVLIYRFWRIYIAINIDISAPVKRHYTIEELSKQYLMNTTTLKSVFKAVYGMPIASYMKEYRMKSTSNMLLQEDKSISEIAAAVGYKSQSKFTSAFRDIFQILPTAYQKLYRNR